jgi:3-methyladenine DNA glycosylase AlkC
VRLASRDLIKLELASRVKQFAGALATTLPGDVPQALSILVDSLPPVLPDCDGVTDGWLQWPMGQFIADHGLPCFEESMVAMVELTQRFSSEFAVRPFVEQHPEKTFGRLQELTSHESPHVRRWCSEGVRPRLPWGTKLRALVTDPTPIWPILEALKDDREIYVRRSVANNLNDIAKDHPCDVVRLCRRWSKDSSRSWLVGRALRTLVNAGDPDALAVIGYKKANSLSATLHVDRNRIARGAKIELIAVLQSNAARSQKLLVDYVVHFVRQKGNANAKVFKWKSVNIPARGHVELTKTHAMRETTIRVLYPGHHRVELQVNGRRVAETSFVLT